jgi:hypothetical protein
MRDLLLEKVPPRLYLDFLEGVPPRLYWVFLEERKVPASLSLFLKREKIPALLYIGKGPEYRPFSCTYSSLTRTEMSSSHPHSNES